MNRIGALEAARIRIARTYVLPMVCLSVPAGLVGQTAADRESVDVVVEALLTFSGGMGDEIPHSPAAWSLVIARLAKGDSREIAIPAKAGEDYEVNGVPESLGTDIDICIYGPAGDQVHCDTLDDSVPVVTFAAKTEGICRAVMKTMSITDQPGASP